MGKQIHFYMTNRDEINFINFIRSDRKTCILPSNLSSENLECLEALPKKPTLSWFKVWLWDMDHSPPPILSFVDKQNYYYVESLFSEVIEFNRSYVDKNRLRPGRIYMQTGYWDESGAYVTKNDEFIKWFERLARWIRRNGKRHNESGFMLPGAQEFAKAGGVISSF